MDLYCIKPTFMSKIRLRNEYCLKGRFKHLLRDFVMAIERKRMLFVKYLTKLKVHPAFKAEMVSIVRIISPIESSWSFA